jgi:hypothetical protein
MSIAHSSITKKSRKTRQRCIHLFRNVLVAIFVCHFGIVYTFAWFDAGLRQEHVLAHESRLICAMDIVHVDMQLSQICIGREPWIRFPFWVNIGRYVWWDHVHHIVECQAWITSLFDLFGIVNAVCGPVCVYQWTKFVDMWLTAGYFFIPLATAICMIWIFHVGIRGSGLYTLYTMGMCKRIDSTPQYGTKDPRHTTGYPEKASWHQTHHDQHGHHDNEISHYDPTQREGIPNTALTHVPMMSPQGTTSCQAQDTEADDDGGLQALVSPWYPTYGLQRTWSAPCSVSLTTDKERIPGTWTMRNGQSTSSQNSSVDEIGRSEQSERITSTGGGNHSTESNWLPQPHNHHACDDDSSLRREGEPELVIDNRNTNMTPLLKSAECPSLSCTIDTEPPWVGHELRLLPLCAYASAPRSFNTMHGICATDSERTDLKASKEMKSSQSSMGNKDDLLHPRHLLRYNF